MSEKSFGEEFAEWRTSHGLGRRWIHQEEGTSLSYLHDVESDEFLPSREKLEAIAGHFGLKADDLVSLRNKAFFEREGLDGEVASELFELGELSVEERQQLIDALKHVRDRRNRQ